MAVDVVQQVPKLQQGGRGEPTADASQAGAAAAAAPDAQAASVAQWADTPHGATTHVTRSAIGRLTRRAIQLPTLRCSGFWHRQSSCGERRTGHG